MINRNFVEKYEGRLTILQFIGFCILILGVIGLIIASFIEAGPTVSSFVSITFFVTMLGFAFAFPSLLEGNEGLSTMRIVVFMITNVICMLLLKIGWACDVDSLEDIGLNQYWVGVIAFVFGAKATQSFFESRMAVATEAKKVGMAAVEFSDEELSRLCIVQNEQFLKVKFPNILSVSDSVKVSNGIETHVIVLYVEDNNTAGMPNNLGVKLPDGTTKTLPTEIITDLDGGKIHFDQQSQLSTDSAMGSICCLVTHKDSHNPMAVTAGHVYSEGNYKSRGGMLAKDEVKKFTLNSGGTGEWIFQLINSRNDLGVIRIDDNTQPSPTLISFKGKGCLTVTNAELKKKVKVVSSKSANQTRDAYILDYKVAFPVPYDKGRETINNLIFIGDKPERADSQSVSVPGDSGGLVYDEVSGKLVGLILGGNSKFTWVLPIEKTLTQFGFSIV
jgi:hypothetical protein